MDFDYESLLSRAKEDLPDDLEVHERWEIPEVEVAVEGNQTILRNLGDLIFAVDREKRHVTNFLLKELGTAGNVDNERMMFKGKLSKRQIQAKFDNYVDTYVHDHRLGREDPAENRAARRAQLGLARLDVDQLHVAGAALEVKPLAAELEHGQLSVPL